MDEILEYLKKVETNRMLEAKKVINIDDVAALTGLSKSHLYKMTCRKEIPYYKPNGKLVYFDRAEVEAWMKQNRVNTAQEASQQAAKYVMEKGGVR